MLEYATPKIQSKTQNKFLFNMSQAVPLPFKTTCGVKFWKTESFIGQAVNFGTVKYACGAG